jgi:hypothetical protein
MWLEPGTSSSAAQLADGSSEPVVGAGMMDDLETPLNDIYNPAPATTTQTECFDNAGLLVPCEFGECLPPALLLACLIGRCVGGGRGVLLCAAVCVGPAAPSRVGQRQRRCHVSAIGAWPVHAHCTACSRSTSSLGHRCSACRCSVKGQGSAAGRTTAHSVGVRMVLLLVWRNLRMRPGHMRRLGQASRVLPPEAARQIAARGRRSADVVCACARVCACVQMTPRR